MAILLLAFETAPVHKKIFGVIDYKTSPRSGWGSTASGSAFFQYTDRPASSPTTIPERDPFGEYGTAKVFDPRAEWLLNHQDARPYGGPSTVLSDEGAASLAGRHGSAGRGQAGRGHQMPGGPGGAGGRASQSIPAGRTIGVDGAVFVPQPPVPSRLEREHLHPLTLH